MLGLLIFFSPFKIYAFKSNKELSTEKLDIDWSSFISYGGALKETKTEPSIIHFNGQQGFSLSDKNYILQVFFSKKVSLSSSLGRQGVILPLSENAFANISLYDELNFTSPEKRYIQFDTCVFYENATSRDYVFLSSDSKNRIDLHTDSKGKLTHAFIVVSLKKGGLQSYAKGIRGLEEQLKKK